MQKSNFHMDLQAKEQGRKCREIHSGVDVEEGLNAFRGMLFCLGVFMAVAGIIWWLTS